MSFRTDPDDIAVPLMERFDVLVLVSRNTDCAHVQFRDPAADRTWVSGKRV